MLKSRVCHKISLFKTIEILNDEGCFEAVRVLRHVADCATWNDCLKKIITATTRTMKIEALSKLDTQIQQISTDVNFINHQVNRNYNETKVQPNCNDVSSNEQFIFPLFRLPIDLIQNTSLFLHEHDIFNFEQCCRLFYQMINNSTYLKQTNNFKSFILDGNRLNQLANYKISFYKYSQAHTLSTTFAHGISRTRDAWNSAKYIDDHFHRHCLTNIFQSIKLLEIDASGMLLLDKFPVEILFKSDSCLQHLKLTSDRRCWQRKSTSSVQYLQNIMEKFENSYLDLKSKLGEQGKKVNKLKLVEHCGGKSDESIMIKGPSFVETDHLSISYIDEAKSVPIVNLFAGIRILTLKHNFNIRKLNNCHSNLNCKYFVETLRLIDFLNYSSTICTDQKVIESLNMQSSLKNLTINVRLRDYWISVIEKIIVKMYYYNLENVNILLEADYNVGLESIGAFFAMLRKHIELLQHQFKQLAIGFAVKPDRQDNTKKYYVFQWHEKINCQSLAKHENSINKALHDDVNRKAEIQYNVLKRQTDF